MTKIIGSSELIINPDGSVYHLHLKPGQIADDIILVGDPERVKLVSGFFDNIELDIQNREFHTVTGSYNDKRITVLSTGIGSDNIDIVLNELDALVNIDFQNRIVRSVQKRLNLIRIGTSGALQNDILVNSFLVSKKSMGFDNLMYFYNLPENFSDITVVNAFKNHTQWNQSLSLPYVIDSDTKLYNRIIDDRFISGITISAPGFYGPQGRVLRLATADPELNSKIECFSFKGMRITNFEMESSALYGLSKLMGHHAITVCLIIANRMVNNSNTSYKEMMLKLIQTVLNKLTNEHF